MLDKPASDELTDAALIEALDDDEGCNCGSPPERRPLLTPELVIAARERAREPELPASTVEIALAASLPATAATYDLVMLAPPDVETARRAWMLAVEFARHEHRVFWIKPATAPERTPKPPKLDVIGLPVTVWAGAGDGPALRAALARLRDEHDIATALFYLPTPKWGALADALRRDWGWRTMAEAQPIEPGLPPIPADGPLPGDLLLDWASRGAGSDDRRLALGSVRTWPERWRAIDRAARALWPRASVIVITYDNLAFSKMCLASVIENTVYPNYELIVIDNGSTDGTPAYLKDLAERFPHVRVIQNDANRGFGPANNQGLAAATGERFVLLNNDTIVPPGWLARLLLPLDDPRLGLVGSATNRTCNEAQIDLDYATYGDYLTLARQCAIAFDGQRIPIRMLAMFCTAFRRDLSDRIGPLDERYELGMFEDEDYALAARAAGYDIAWVPAVYVHHAYHASIGKLLPSGDYLTLFRANQARFEEKWGICWERHRPAPPAPAT